MQVPNKYLPPPTSGIPTPLAYGIVLSITPSDATYNVEVWRAPDNGAGSPDVGNAVLADSRLYRSIGDIFVDPLPNDYAKRFYRWRHTVSGGTAGGYTAWVWARPDFLPQTYGLPGSGQLVLRQSPLADGGYAVVATDPSGMLVSAPVVQTDGAGSRTIVRGTVVGAGVGGSVSGAAWTDGAAITFPVAFQNTPHAYVREGHGISVEPRGAKWTGAYSAAAPTYDDSGLVNVSASGATVRARLRQKGVVTGRTADYAHLNAATSVGASVASGVLANAPASDDTYVNTYNLTIAPVYNNKGQQIQLVIALDSAPDGSTWTQRNTTSYNFTPTPLSTSGLSWNGETMSAIVGGLTGTAEMRLRIVSATGPINTMSLHGYRAADDVGAGVTYNTATDIYASKTPDADDSVAWEAKAIA